MIAVITTQLQNKLQPSHGAGTPDKGSVGDWRPCGGTAQDWVSCSM